MARVFFTTLLFVSIALSVSRGLRYFLIERHAHEARRELSQKLQVSEDLLSVQALQFMRGDYLVSLNRPPFQSIDWTINVRTHEVIPWQSNQLREQVLKVVHEN